MLRVDLRQARPGMELAIPVTHPRSPGTVLLRAGFTLDAKTIARLEDLQAREIWIRYPGLDFIAEHISPGIVQAGQQLSGAIGAAFGEVVEGASADLEYASYRRVIHEMMDRILDTPKARIFVVDLASSQIPLARSAGQGSYLSLLLGLKLETYLMVSRSRLGAGAKDVSNLGMGALLRDIGMIQLPDDVRWRWRATRDDSDPAWREHVQIGYQLVRGAIEPSAAAAVLHHHQRYDGSGFPSRTLLDGGESPYAGRDIHIFARIVGAVDLFDRMRFPATDGPGDPEPPPIPVVRVLQRMLRGPESRWLDPVVVKALVNVVPPFPPGSLVTLSNGLRCAVVEWDPHDPCRPTVAVLHRHALEPGRFEEPRERIHLAEVDELHIAEAEGHTVTDDLFFPVTPDELDVHKVQTAMISRSVESLQPAAG